MNQVDSRPYSVSDIRSGLEADEFYFCYQPKISFETGHLVGAEALLRWHHEDAVVQPAQFIPLAEQEGLMPDIFVSMLEKLVADIAVMRGAAVNPPISVNLSPGDLSAGAPTEALHQAVCDGSIDGTDVQVEITESMVLVDDSTVRRAISKILDDGIKLLMDDFGTGYSSIDALSKFPFSYVKLDRGLISRMAVSLKNYRIIKGILHLTHDLNLATVAEGVETRSDYQTLQMMGCTEAQGFYIRPAMALDEFLMFADNSEYLPGTQIGTLFNIQGSLSAYRQSIVGSVMCAVGDDSDGNLSAIEQEIEHDPTGCKFGRWYYGPEVKHLSAFSIFSGMEDTHIRMRELGLELIHGAHSGNVPFVEIMSKMQEFNACGIELDQSMGVLIESYLVEEKSNRRVSGVTFH